MSWQSYLLNILLRLNRGLLQHFDHLSNLRRTFARLDTWQGKNKAISQGWDHYGCGDYHVDRYHARNAPELPKAEQKLMLFLHGGAYSLRSPNLYKITITEICDALNCIGIMPDYRLAPEYPHPAGIDDCILCYSKLLEEGYLAKNIIIAGDSAGGGLTASVLQATLHNPDHRPAAAVLISPAGDWSFSGRSYFVNEAKDPMFRIGSFLFLRHLYLAGQNMIDPSVSPLFGSFKNFPPCFFTTSTSELLRDTAVAMHEQIIAEGGESELHMANGLCHIYPFFGFLPEAKQTKAEIIAFCQRHW